MTEPEEHFGDGDSGVRLAISTLKVSFGSLATLMAGLVSQLTIAGFFGSGVEMDAFLTAGAVPGYLSALLWALSFVVVPEFVKQDSTGNGDDAWALVGTVIWLVGGGLAVVSLLGIVGAPAIIATTAPGLAPSKSQLTADMFAVVMVALPVAVIGTMSSGVQNARGKFLWPALAPAFGSLANVAVVLLGRGTLGSMVLVWGALTSTLVQSSMTLGPVLRHGWPYLMPLNDPRLLRIGKLVAPFLLFGIVGKANPVLQRFFASGLPDGELSYLGYADKVASVFSSLISAPIATAIFPAMAKTFALRGKTGLGEMYVQGLRLTLALGLPAFTVLSVISVPVVTVLLERGRFDHIATIGAAAALPYLLVVVVFHMLNNIISRALYVQGKTFSFPMVSALTTLAYPFVATLLLSMGYLGLALAQALTNGAAVVAGLLLVQRELGAGWPRSIVSYGAFAVIGAIVAYLASLPPTLSSNSFMTMLAGGGCGIGAYVGLLLIFDTEARQFVSGLLQRLSAGRLHPLKGGQPNA